MIQRIQTVYLFVVVILTALFLFMTIGEFVGDDHYVFDAYSISKVAEIEDTTVATTVINAVPLGILALIVLLTALLAIFMYKNRKIQMRVVSFGIALQIGVIIMIAFYAHYLAPDYVEADISYNYPVIFPIINFILLILAYRGIRKDENLIRSADRIR